MLRKQIAELEESLLNSKQLIQQLQSDNGELVGLRKSMLTSLETLDAENQEYSGKIKELNEVIVELRNGGVGQDNAERCRRKRGEAVTRMEYDTGDRGNYRRLLILSDQQGYGLNRILQKRLSNFCVQMIIKPHACYRDIIQDLRQLTGGFTGNDFVVILAGVNDFKNGRYPLFRNINGIIKQCTHTNIVITSVPYFRNDMPKNQSVFKFNTRLRDYLVKLDQFSEAGVYFVDVNRPNTDYTMGKSSIAREIDRIVRMKGAGSGNLRFVRAVDLAGEERTVVGGLDTVAEADLLVNPPINI